MWAQLVDGTLLFTTDSKEIVNLMGDAPFTAGFPKESPGMAGVWIGWRMVRRFAEKNPELTLNQVMNERDDNKILKAYKPGY